MKPSFDSLIVAGFSLLGLVGEVVLGVGVFNFIGDVPSAIVEVLVKQSEALKEGDSEANVVTIRGDVFKPVGIGSCVNVFKKKTIRR